jgi:hypothetical protein
MWKSTPSGQVRQGCYALPIETHNLCLLKTATCVIMCTGKLLQHVAPTLVAVVEQPVRDTLRIPQEIRSLGPAFRAASFRTSGLNVVVAVVQSGM